MSDPNLDEILATYRRLHDLCRSVDVALVAYLHRGSFELLSARVTVGTGLTVAPPRLFKRGNWFALRTRHPPHVFERCLEWTTKGRYWEKLLKEQPGEVIPSQAPRPWASNGFGRSRAVVLGSGDAPISASVVTSWGKTFSTSQVHREWVNDIEASDDFHDLTTFIDVFALRQPFRSPDEPRQVHAEVEIPLYEEQILRAPEATTVRFATPVRSWTDLKAKWKRGNETGLATVTESDGYVDLIVQGRPIGIELSLVYRDQPLAKMPVAPPPADVKGLKMALSDRQAADARATKAVGEVHAQLARSLAANRGTNDALVFRRGLHEGVRDLRARLVDIYADVAASQPSLRDELVKAIADRVAAFISSSVASRRGSDSVVAAREAARLVPAVSIDTGRDFDLAVHERLKKASLAGTTDATMTVLFLSANPDPNNPLDVEKEQNRVAKVRNGSKHQDRVRIESLPDLDLPEFAKSLRLHRPTIVHFCGHGGPDGSLTIRDQDGHAYDMAPKGLAKLLALQKSTTRLIVLNACFSNALADLLIADVDCVIGMRIEVADDAAILFAQVFYGALFDGSSLGEAFATATAVVGARYCDESDIPVLRARVGVDPDSIRLIS